MFTDEEVVEVFQQYKDLQEEFKEVHKMSEKYKSQLISPGEIKKAIGQMEEDRNLLEHKVEALHAKLQSTSGFDDMLVACSKLRVEQDEQLKLQDRFKEQKSHLMQAEHRLNHLKATLGEKRQTEMQEDLGKVMKKLDEQARRAESPPSASPLPLCKPPSPLRHPPRGRRPRVGHPSRDGAALPPAPRAPQR